MAKENGVFDFSNVENRLLTAEDPSDYCYAILGIASCLAHEDAVWMQRDELRQKRKLTWSVGPTGTRVKHVSDLKTYHGWDWLLVALVMLVFSAILAANTVLSDLADIYPEMALPAAPLPELAEKVFFSGGPA